LNHLSKELVSLVTDMVTDMDMRIEVRIMITKMVDLAANFARKNFTMQGFW